MQSGTTYKESIVFIASLQRRAAAAGFHFSKRFHPICTVYLRHTDAFLWIVSVTYRSQVLQQIRSSQGRLERFCPSVAMMDTLHTCIRTGAVNQSFPSACKDKLPPCSPLSSTPPRTFHLHPYVWFSQDMGFFFLSQPTSMLNLNTEICMCRSATRGRPPPFPALITP